VIVWTEQATRQLDQVQDFISLSNSPEVSLNVVFQILASVEQLARFPMLGRRGRVAGSRDLIIPNTPFIVAYTLEDNKIAILAVYHGSQQWPEAF
jgi:toxin ParE1/3/4